MTVSFFQYTAHEVGERFEIDITYLAAGQRVSVINEMLNNDKDLERKYQHVKSLVKI
jgi:hypothetical protein